MRILACALYCCCIYLNCSLHIHRFQQQRINPVCLLSCFLLLNELRFLLSIEHPGTESMKTHADSSILITDIDIHLLQFCTRLFCFPDICPCLPWACLKDLEGIQRKWQRRLPLSALVRQQKTDRSLQRPVHDARMQNILRMCFRYCLRQAHFRQQADPPLLSANQDALYRLLSWTIFNPDLPECLITLLASKTFLFTLPLQAFDILLRGRRAFHQERGPHAMNDPVRL